ncbi:MAG: fumarate hydratase [Tenericutes bacterium GWF2_57_13]|nr:MAG: fumarate hydratase [Tenericutes bacterium GWF2_57_13]
METMQKITLPMNEATRLSLHAGDRLLLSGVIYTGRDAAHQRMVDALKKHEEPPFAYDGSLIYYTGPSPAKPGRPIGACGPTSSYRMDPFAIELMPAGLKIMLGKGPRGKAFRDALVKQSAVYLVVTGGIGALLSKRVLAAATKSYPDLGAEAVYRLEVVDFPAVVAYDAHGANLYGDIDE